MFDLLLKRRTATWNLFVLYNKETNYYSFFFFQNLLSLLESRPLPTLTNTKKAIWRNLQSHWLLCIAKSCDWSRKIAPLSTWLELTASREIKTYSESRIKLRNPQILMKMLGKSRQFLSSEQPCEPRSLDNTLNATGVERIRLKNLRLHSTLKAIRDSSFEWKER